MIGLLNINKPPGMTSRDVVNRVQRLVRPAKAGHAGTLDPLAVGVLVVCVGPATRLIEFVQEMPKSYVAGFRLGCRSDTDDAEGEVMELPDSHQPTLDEVTAVIPRFVGEIRQRPPAYSALKVRGQPAYARARRGELVELAARPVHIARIELRSYQFPHLELAVDCGSGTYIRALGRDLAESLGTGAIMIALERTAIGRFSVQNAVRLDDLTADTLPSCLYPPTIALADRPQLTLDGAQRARVTRGQFLKIVQHGFSRQVAAVDEAGQLVAVLVPHGEDELRPSIVLQAEQR